MFRKSFLFILFAAVFTLAVHHTAYAQLAPLNGLVVLEKDGKTEPVANAVIELFRVEIKGFHETKTNKKGEFKFAGVAYGEYVISVSAPNCAPALVPKIRAGSEGLKITMYPGNGRKYTEAEAKKGAAEIAKSGDDAGPSEEDRKAQAEVDKKNEEITARNEKIKNADAIASKSNTEGRAALDAKNYDLAIAKYSEGVAAVPDYVGTTPILLVGKIEALRFKGFDLYRLGAASAEPDARLTKYKEANQSYDNALAAFQQAMTVMKGAASTTDAAEQKQRDLITMALYSSAAEIHRLKAVTGDSSKIAEAGALYGEYIAMLTDPARKTDAQMSLGDIMRRTGDFEKAVEAYRKVLELKPDHADATGQLGLSLFGLGSGIGDKEKEQEGLNYMQKYIDMAPVSPSDSSQTKELKESIKQAVDYLKKEQKMAPQKVPAAPKKKN